MGRDGKEYLIEVNDSATTLMGESQEEDRKNIAELVLKEMEVSHYFYEDEDNGVQVHLDSISIVKYEKFIFFVQIIQILCNWLEKETITWTASNKKRSQKPS